VIRGKWIDRWHDRGLTPNTINFIQDQVFHTSSTQRRTLCSAIFGDRSTLYSGWATLPVTKPLHKPVTHPLAPFCQRRRTVRKTRKGQFNYTVDHQFDNAPMRIPIR